MTKATVPFGGDVRTTTLDLVLSTIVALGLPFAALWLLDATGGAAAGLALYYGLCCVALVRWRKGALDYRRPARWPWMLFIASLLLPLGNAALNWGALPNYGASALGLLLTALLWAPLNACMEQLAWIYVLDAWRNRWASGALRWVGLVVGIALLVALVSLIHILFWARFLPETSAPERLPLTIGLNLALTASYVLLYRRARSMWPTALIHLLVDLQLVLLANYSILGSL